MPVLNGIQTANEIHSSRSRTKIVFLTVHEDPDFAAAAFSAGASSYVVKADFATDLVPSIHEALEGRRSEIILTYNLKHFPEDSIKPLNICVKTPDE